MMVAVSGVAAFRGGMMRAVLRPCLPMMVAVNPNAKAHESIGHGERRFHVPNQRRSTRAYIQDEVQVALSPE
jgi:hypothetical protein